MKRFAVVLAVTVLALMIASCASLQRSRDTGSVRTVAGLINDRDAAALSSMSSVPFLLDHEIVALQRDVQAFWGTALETGFRVEEPTLERGLRVDAESYREFYDSMEVKTFFKKYLKKNTRLLELRTLGGQRILLLVTDTWFKRTINGFKGPF
jgi:hypothetical protein